MQQSWRQAAFETRLDEWIELEGPSLHLRRLVTAWVLTRLENPYDGMQRQQGFANLWFGRIPGTYQPGDGTVVVCSLWIEESSRMVRCDRIGTLTIPY